jgi:hypothetical protein
LWSEVKKFTVKRAEGDPAGMDAGSRLLTIDRIGQVGRRLDPVWFLQGLRKVGASELCSLSPQVQRSKGSRWPGGHEYSYHSLLVASFSPRYLSMEAAICCGRERLVERSQKFAAKRRPKTTFSLTKTEDSSPTWNPFHALQRWRKVGASELCSLSPQVQRSKGSRWPGGHGRPPPAARTWK